MERAAKEKAEKVELAEERNQTVLLSLSLSLSLSLCSLHSFNELLFMRFDYMFPLKTVR